MPYLILKTVLRIAKGSREPIQVSKEREVGNLLFHCPSLAYVFLSSIPRPMAWGKERRPCSLFILRDCVTLGALLLQGRADTELGTWTCFHRLSNAGAHRFSAGEKVRPCAWRSAGFTLAVSREAMFPRQPSHTQHHPPCHRLSGDVSKLSRLTQGVYFFMEQDPRRQNEPGLRALFRIWLTTHYTVRYL